MTKSLLTLGLAALATVANATTVAVVEIGKGGVVHHSTASSPSTSTHGIMSLLKSVHEVGHNGAPRKERATQFPGMSVVPDLFNRADGGVVIGITGNINLESMPTVSGIMQEDGAVAHLHASGNQGRNLGKLLSSKSLEASEFESALSSKVESVVSSGKNKYEPVFVNLEENDAADVDAILKRTLKKIADGVEDGKTVLAYIAIDEDNEDARRRLSIEDRKLAGDDDANNANDQEDAYAGIAASYGYRTIFQIQYYNIVLWTALGLFLILLSANMMTMYMPLMPDTLLFGESAKMVAE
jgi:hypothetical protein